jgi:Ca2+-binding RTX toxin-like protein
MTCSIRSARSMPFVVAVAVSVVGLTVLPLAQTPAPPNPCGPSAAPVGQTAPPAAQAPPPGAGTATGRAGGPPTTKETPPEGARLLEGTDQDERLVGGSGDDWLLGKKGNDRLFGCDGKDKMDGGEDDDYLAGGPGDDIMDGGAGRDIIFGGAGNDTLDGGDDDDAEDIIYGDDGDDDIDGGDGNSELHGGAGNDNIAGSDDAVDRIFGDGGDDRINGFEGNDILFGGAGNDIIFGGDDNDSITGDAGDDRCDGGEGNDTLFGGLGDDTLLGSTGSDSLHGEAGHDHLFGGAGDDWLSGGPGHDWVLGGPGADTIDGGLGDDIIVLRAGDVPPAGFELINGGDGRDILFLSGFMRAFKVGDDFRVVDPSTGGAYIIVNVEKVEYTMLLAPSMQEGAQAISMLVVNPSTAAVNGRLVFFGATGEVVPAAMANQPAREQLSFTVPALGSLRLTDVRLAAPAVPQMFAGAPLSASLLGGPAGPDVIHGQMMLYDIAIVPVLEEAGRGGGFIIANSSTTSSVRLTLRKMDGSETDEQVAAPQQISLPAYGHKVLYIRDLYPTLKDYRGTLTVESGFGVPGQFSQEGGSISVMMLDRATGGAVTGLPALPVDSAASAGPVYLPRIAAGPGASSSIVLINPMITTRSTGTLRLYDEAGAPRAGLGVTPATSIPFDIGSMGSVVIPVAPGAGSARVDVTRGKIGALLRVTAGAQTSHVASSDVAEGFIGAAVRDRTAGVTTNLAISSGPSGASVRAELRTAAGERVANGEATLQLAANGSATRTLEQLFPAAAIDAFEGTLTIRTDGASVAASVLRVGPSAAPPVALPLMRLQ